MTFQTFKLAFIADSFIYCWGISHLRHNYVIPRQWCLRILFFFLNSWVGGITVNQSDSQFQHYCFTQGVSVSIIPAGMRIQLQRKVNLDMFIQTQLLYLKQCISALTLKITRKHASHQRLQQTKCDISNSIWGKERFVSRLHEHPKPYSIQELVKCFFNKCCFSEFNAKIILYN